MKPFPIVRILDLFRAFTGAFIDSEMAAAVAKSPQEAKELAQQVQPIIDECIQWGFPLTADQFIRIQSQIRENVTNAKMQPLIADALNRLQDECKRVVVVHIEYKHLEYFQNPQFFDRREDVFDPEVSTSFPSAGDDIAEAGKCLACGCATACVMHLGRVLEVGLRTLAAEVGVGGQNDWGKYLEKIEAELSRRLKTSGARSPDEQFYAESHAMFDSVRRAWRNPTMHVDKSYSPERAEEILIAVRSFMRHLATRLKETP
jgi:hypothetical protein